MFFFSPPKLGTSVFLRHFVVALSCKTHNYKGGLLALLSRGNPTVSLTAMGFFFCYLLSTLGALCTPPYTMSCLPTHTGLKRYYCLFCKHGTHLVSTETEAHAPSFAAPLVGKKKKVPPQSLRESDGFSSFFFFLPQRKHLLSSGTAVGEGR